MFAADSPLALVADIGGTNTRLALAGRDRDGRVAIARREDLRNAEHDGVEACVRAYLGRIDAARPPSLAAFGVASAIDGDEVRLTNHDWAFSIARLKAAFGWTRFEVVNDFVAIGHALACLRPADWRPLRGPAWPSSLPERVCLIGPGTGLGVGQVLRAGEMVVPTEGGHAGFAPQDDFEIDILRILAGRFAHVSNERIASGPGLVELWRAMAEIAGRAAPPPAAPAIVEAAAADPFARAVVERFCLILAGAMGDAALVQGAEAVAIAGGIGPRILQFLDADAVRARFEAKGRRSPLMAKMPLAVIAHPAPGLLGAARLLLA